MKKLSLLILFSLSTNIFNPVFSKELQVKEQNIFNNLKRQIELLENVDKDINLILEKAKNVHVIPADLGWSDLGTWNSIYENADKDHEENASKSKYLLSYNSKGNLIKMKKNKALVIDGLENYIIVDTDKALLICPRDNDQLLKEYIQDLKTLKKGEKFL